MYVKFVKYLTSKFCVTNLSDIEIGDEIFLPFIEEMSKLEKIRSV